VNFLADEGVDGQIVVGLRNAGHFVSYVAEMEPGISDDVVLDRANKEEALLLTADKDFGELIFRQRRLSRGIVLLRLSGLSAAKKAEIVVDLVNKHSQELMAAYSVITYKGIRIRLKTT
jgi:predicted nuclease of predicted toxin-antitoxin system